MKSNYDGSVLFLQEPLFYKGLKYFDKNLSIYRNIHLVAAHNNISPEFGEIRTTTLNGEPMFCLADVCKALEISNVSQLKTRLNQGGVISNEVGAEQEQKQMELLQYRK